MRLSKVQCRLIQHAIDANTCNTGIYVNLCDGLDE